MDMVKDMDLYRRTDDRDREKYGESEGKYHRHKNISNINTEQNLFEMIMGTCKIKIDTSSLSTADQTDVKIVLKKADAEAFRRTGAVLLKEAKGEATEEGLSVVDDHGRETFDVTASTADILRHGFCSITVLSLVVVVVGVGGLIEVLSRLTEEGEVLKTAISSIVGILAAFSFILSAIWDIVKDFIRYFDC